MIYNPRFQKKEKIDHIGMLTSIVELRTKLLTSLED